MNESNNARLSAADLYEIAAEEHDLAMAIGPEPTDIEYEIMAEDHASRAEARDEKLAAEFDGMDAEDRAVARYMYP